MNFLPIYFLPGALTLALFVFGVYVFFRENKASRSGVIAIVISILLYFLYGALIFVLFVGAAYMYFRSDKGESSATLFMRCIAVILSIFLLTTLTINTVNAFALFSVFPYNSPVTSAKLHIPSSAVQKTKSSNIPSRAIMHCLIAEKSLDGIVVTDAKEFNFNLKEDINKDVNFKFHFLGSKGIWTTKLSDIITIKDATSPNLFNTALKGVSKIFFSSKKNRATSTRQFTYQEGINFFAIKYPSPNIFFSHERYSLCCLFL